LKSASVVEDRDLVRDPARALEADPDLGLALVALDLNLDPNPALDHVLVIVVLDPNPNPALDPNLEVDPDQLIAMAAEIPRRMVNVKDPDRDPAPDLNLDPNLNPNLEDPAPDLSLDPNPNLEVDPGPNPEMTKRKEKTPQHCIKKY